MSAEHLPGARETLTSLRDRTRSAVELIDATIARVRKSPLGAFELLDEQGARAQAERADAALARGEAGALAGLPVIVKDVIDVGGLPTRGGTARWQRTPKRDADCVAALRAAGAVVIGKGHTNELAFGIDGRNPHRAPCCNPHDTARLPGGSSSGPAVAVAAGLALAGLGTDTSGSIRVPAALCGVAGLRPTHGRLSRRGVLALAPSYDVVGPLAPRVDDLRLLFAALLGSADVAARASTASRAEEGLSEPPRPLDRVLLVESLLAPDACESVVAETVREAADALAEDGVRVDHVALPELDGALAVHRDVQLPQAAESVRALAIPEDELGREVRDRVRSAREIGAERHVLAVRERARIAAAIDRALPAGAALLAPGCAITAPPREAQQWRFHDGRVVSLRDALLACTVPLTQAAGPVLSVPLGRPGGLPVGAQLLARPGEDERLLELGSRLERLLA